MSKLLVAAAAAINGPSRMVASKIRRDGGTQMRSELSMATVADYTETMRSNQSYEPFPPVVVFFDGTEYWMADGFHRIVSASNVFGVDFEIPCEIRPGTRREAILHAAGANSSHGLRRSVDDKRRAVIALLADEEWSQWSDREIARRCNVSHTMVQAYRKPALTGNVASEKPEPSKPITGNVASERKYTTKHGTESTMKSKAPILTGNVASEKTDNRRDFASQENERSRLHHIYQTAVDNLSAYTEFTGDDMTRTWLVLSAIVKRLELAGEGK